jgi:hypothetical protein
LRTTRLETMVSDGQLAEDIGPGRGQLWQRSVNGGRWREMSRAH